MNTETQNLIDKTQRQLSTTQGSENLRHENNILMKGVKRVKIYNIYTIHKSF